MPEAVVAMSAEFERQRAAYRAAAGLPPLAPNPQPVSPRQPPARQNGPVISATPYVWTDPGEIPKRQFMYGRSLIRHFLSTTVAPGGVGKSSLAIVEALAMATGRALLGHQVERESRAWIWNLEDPLDELQRRIQAACEFYDVSAEDLGGRLFVNSGRDHPLVIASMGRNGAIIHAPVVEALIDELKARQIDLLIIDPFVSSHSVAENDNTAMDRVAKQWSYVADKAGVAIHLIHHARKLGSDAEVTTESARGAKALTDASRVVRAINRMSKEEAEGFGVENHRQFFKAINDKANMSPPADLADWYRIENVELPNGDHVGVVTAWQPPRKEDAIPPVSDEAILAIQRKIELSEWRYDPRSSHWAGEAVADVLGVDAESKIVRSEIRSLIEAWIKIGLFKVTRRTGSSKNVVPFLEVSNWIL
jgi:hypothetical protein